MGLEGTHTEFVGQGKSLLVVGFGLRSIRRGTRHGNVTEEPQGIRLIAAFFVGTGQVKRLLGKGAPQLFPTGHSEALAPGKPLTRCYSRWMDRSIHLCFKTVRAGKPART